MTTKQLSLHKTISARLFARQCWPVSTPVVKLYAVTEFRGYVDGLINVNKYTTASFHGFTK